MINAAREARYQTFILTAYSMGLRLGETLNLTIADIDGEYPRVHIRRGKGHKDRYVTLPRISLLALWCLWLSHRHPTLIFPPGKDAGARRVATAPMDRGGMVALTSIIERYRGKFCSTYGNRITRHQIRAMDAMIDCRTARYDSMALGCDDCDQQSIQYHACGNRAFHRPAGRPATP
jgi:integrase/recombinase XerD